jgi:hypothetical protein
MNIGDSYNMNTSIMNQINVNPTTFKAINVESSYWLWLGSFVDSLYVDEYYSGFPIPENKKHAMPNLNVLATPIRITQRRMKLVSNDDEYT